MGSNYKLDKKETIIIMIMIMINKLILNVPYYIVNLVGTGSIANIIYIGIIDFIFLLIIIKLLKKFENHDIIDISEFVGGKFLKSIIGIISIALFLLGAFITLLDFSNVLHTIYFSNFDMIYIVFFFLIVILIANLLGLKSISHSITFIVPFVLISILITFFAVWNSFDISNLTPILGKDYYTTFVLGASNSFAMYIIVYSYFIKPYLKNSNEFKKISILSYIFCLAILLITTISMLTLFNTNSGNEPINSLFLLARQIELGTFIQRIDALFILLWILSTFSYLSFVIFIINKIVKKLTNISNEKMFSFTNCSILFGLTLIPFNVSDIHFIENIVYRYAILGFMFGLGIIILIIANIKKIRSKA